MVLKATALFEQMGTLMKTNGADLVKKVDSVFFFEISAKKGGEVTAWTIDLKNGTGVIFTLNLYLFKALLNGRVGTADATFVMLDDDLISMSQGTLNPQQAFMQGKMKIKGKYEY